MQDNSNSRPGPRGERGENVKTLRETMPGDRQMSNRLNSLVAQRFLNYAEDIKLLRMIRQLMNVLKIVGEKP